MDFLEGAGEAVRSMLIFLADGGVLGNSRSWFFSREGEGLEEGGGRGVLDPEFALFGVDEMLCLGGVEEGSLLSPVLSISSRLSRLFEVFNKSGLVLAITSGVASDDGDTCPSVHPDFPRPSFGSLSSSSRSIISIPLSSLLTSSMSRLTAGP